MIASPAGDDGVDVVSVGGEDGADVVGIDHEDAAATVLLFLKARLADLTGEEGGGGPEGAGKEAGGVGGGGHGEEAGLVEVGEDVLGFVEDEEEGGGGTEDV